MKEEEEFAADTEPWSLDESMVVFSGALLGVATPADEVEGAHEELAEAAVEESGRSFDFDEEDVFVSVSALSSAATLCFFEEEEAEAAFFFPPEDSDDVSIIWEGGSRDGPT